MLPTPMMGYPENQAEAGPPVKKPVDRKPAEPMPGLRSAISLRRAAAFVLYNIAATLLLLLLLEGAASVYYAFRAAFARPPVAESLYTKYDPELGWISLPNVYLPNMFGPGRFLRTNAQQFRNGAAFTPRVPLGKTRIICSGDSFTFGFGVDNNHTWPHLLAKHAANLETVNMGQGGYGAEQAYLWYKRDGVKLDHDIQIFAVIAPDLYRMQHSRFNGYGKPVLAVENGKLVATNIPVPRTMQVWSPRLVRAENALSNLNLTRLLRGVFRLGSTPVLAPSKEHNQETATVVAHMLDDLQETNVAKQSVLVLVYLPTQEDLPPRSGPSWRGYLAEYAQEHGLSYFDLVDDFRKLPPAQQDKLFIAPGQVDFPGAAGHYSEAGNAFVAELIYQRLLANPETAAKLRAP